MIYQIDSNTEHVMRSWISADSGYVTLAWPKNLTLAELDFCKEVCDHQLDAFRKRARMKSDGEIEYDSWQPDPPTRKESTRTKRRPSHE